jgi:hypothetical protein
MVGSGSGDTLVGPNTASTWVLGGPDTGTLNGSFTFSAVDNLRGGSGSDTFTLGPGSSVSGRIDASPTATLDYSGYGSPISVNLQGQSATGTGGISGIGHLIGSSATTDSLTGPNGANSWTLTGPNAGSLNGTLSFTSIEDLIGGTGSDTFTFAAGGSISGTISGAGGTDTLDYSTYGSPATVNLQSQSATATAGFSGISALLGSGTSVTLVGPDSSSTWNITGSNAGTVNGTCTFSGVANLTGGSGDDSFVFGPGGGVTGMIDGGAGSNTLDYSGSSTGVTVNLQTGTASGTGEVKDVVNVTGSLFNDVLTGSDSGIVAGGGGGDTLSAGGSGTHTFVLSAAQGAGTSISGDGSDTLVGADTASTWTLSGAGAGDVNGATFSGIANLVGGKGNDTFAFKSGGSVTGTLTGGGGTDTLDYSAYSGALSVNLQTQTATGTGGFAGIGKLVGGVAATSTLIGASTANTWTLTGPSAGTVNAVAFSRFGNLRGGSGTDIFAFRRGGSVAGGLTGGGGSDWLDYSAYGAAVTVNLTSGKATGVGQSVKGITNVQGSAVRNTLTGSVAGGVLVGGAGSDTLTAGKGRSILVGAGGSDTLTGGPDQDILIAGTLNFGAKQQAALAAIFAEWSRTNETYAVRLSHLRTGVGAGKVYRLALGKTVLDDHRRDVLRGDPVGKSALDWFFADLTVGQDTILDRKTGEVVN